MKKSKQVAADTEPLEEYDFRGGVRGKYADRFRSGTNLILLDPDVAASFPDARSVNEALRALLQLKQALRSVRDSSDGGS
jgi:hypothetical protein